MNTIWFFNQLDHTNDYISKIVKEKHPKTIILNTDTEWYWKLEKEDIDQWYNQGVENIRIIYSSDNCEYYQQLYNNLNIPLENICFWKTFWFNWGELLLRHEYDYTKLHNPTEFTSPFICLNNKPHDHRCMLIDNLSRLNLLTKGVVTWNNFPKKNLRYPWKYYSGNNRFLQDDFFNKQDSFLICDEVEKSLLHIVAEATTTVPFITEKTVKPLLFKRPFVVLGCKSFNRYLENLGFELYDEIIDYRFDDESDDFERATMLAEALVPFSKESDFKKIYEKIKPKIEHNYNRIHEIIKTNGFIPDLIRERIDTITIQPELQVSVDGRYKIFLEQANI